MSDLENTNNEDNEDIEITDELAVEDAPVRVLNKRQKLKKHLYDNRKIYIVGGICLVVGATVATIILKRQLPSGKIVSDIANEATASAAINGVAVNSPVTSTTNNYNTVVANFPEFSTPSKVVQCIEDGWVEPSISKAAERANTTRERMSALLNGRASHINGKHYEIVHKIDPNYMDELLTKVDEATKAADMAKAA